MRWCDRCRRKKAIGVLSPYLHSNMYLFFHRMITSWFRHFERTFYVRSQDTLVENIPSCAVRSWCGNIVGEIPSKRKISMFGRYFGKFVTTCGERKQKNHPFFVVLLRPPHVVGSLIASEGWTKNSTSFYSSINWVDIVFNWLRVLWLYCVHFITILW